MSIRLRSELLRDENGRIPFRIYRGDGREHYHVRLWIEGDTDELDRISSVEYHLHPTFAKPRRLVERRDDNFSLSIWTWGYFQIEVRINMRDGSVQGREMFLSYELPPDTGDNYVRFLSNQGNAKTTTSALADEG